MRIAVISDIHSNLEALTAALDDLGTRSVDRTVCLGDIVGYGASPRECLELVQKTTSDIIMGNHDEAAFDPTYDLMFSSMAKEAIRWTRTQLTPDDMGFLRSLPMSISFENIQFVHATPAMPEQFGYIFSSIEARLYADSFTERVCLVGHSHIPFVYGMDPSVREYNPVDRFIINPGSVGQPRDGDSRLSYGILDTVAGTWENIRLPYDIQSAAGRITARRLPSRLAQRLFAGQ